MPLLLSDTTESIREKARQICMRMGHFYLGCEHIFLAVLESEDWLSSFLEESGADPDEVATNISNICGPPDEKPMWEGIIETPRLKKIFKKYAGPEAEDMKALRIEPHHVIAALCREGRSIPIRVLEGLEVDIHELQEHAKNLLASGSQGGNGIPPGIFPPAGTPQSRFMAEGGGKGQIPPQRQPGVFSPPPAAMAGQIPAQGKSSPPPWAGGKPEKEKKKRVKTPTLDKMGRDLVKMAQEGGFDPIVGRKDEIRRVIQTLTKKMKNNPIIIGEAGVGKTAVVYGLAQRIAEGRVPRIIKDKTIIELGMASLVAGAKHRGEFEERMEKLVQELKGNRDIILFIDEIHTMMGAGDSRGALNAANILKPHLARNEITIIGATTIEEYRTHLEKDPALERRFQPVMVEEPTEEDTITILEGLKDRYEKHHGVVITPRAIQTAVRMSVRYIPDRNLPDKAIDLIDEAAAKCQMVFTSASCSQELNQCPTQVTEDNIAEVISLWTGIPASALTQEESQRLMHIEEHLRERVIGQDHVIEVAAQTIRMARMGLTSPGRPSGVFLFLGPTGVGKTELAKSLAEFLFGSERDLIRLDMSEYMEKHSVSKLIGAPPGYIGSDEEGQLTGKVRSRPYSVVLLDEVEKAHAEVFDLFLQVFDDGRLTDSKGRTVNFTNTIIILTSNIGMSAFTQGGAKQIIDTRDPKVRDEIMRELRGHFRPEFLNRIDEIIIFNSLGREALSNIVNINLKNLADQLFKQKEIQLHIDETLINYLLHKGYDPAYGARPMKRAIANYLSKPLAEAMLAAGVQNGNSIYVWYDRRELVFEEKDRGEIFRREIPPVEGSLPPEEYAEPFGKIPRKTDAPGEIKSDGFDILPINKESRVAPEVPWRKKDDRQIPEDPEDFADTLGRKPSPFDGGNTAGKSSPEDDPVPKGLFRPRIREGREDPGKTRDDSSPPDPRDIADTPFHQRRPILRHRNGDMGMMGIAPLKGPKGLPGKGPGDLDSDDFDETRPGGGNR